MARIKCYVDFDERRKTHNYRDFEIVESLPKIGEVVWGDYDRKDSKCGYNGQRQRVTEIIEIAPDCENADDVWKYLYYAVKVQMEEWDDEANVYIVNEDWEEVYFYAVEK